MDALSPSDPCQLVALKFSSQTGKTEVILNFTGYIIEQDPGPILAIQPNQRPMGEAFSKDRIAPMLRDTPSLKGLVISAKGRESGNTMFHKSFAGGHLSIGGANSPAQLASRPIRYLLCDEIDRWEVTKEGHALPLARKRTTTFWNKKILCVSSPTYDGVGIDAEYQGCDQQWELHLRCQHCEETQRPTLKHFQWPTGKPQDAVYVCEHCGATHELTQEDRIKSRSVWVCVKDEGETSKGFWMNQWGSPFARWRQTIAEFLAAKNDPEKLRTVVNTAFAEGWEEAGESVPFQGLLDRREPYTPAELPAGVLALVAGVDVQDDRLEYEIVGYGPAFESWGIDRGAIYGDPGKSPLWAELDAQLQRKFQHPTGHVLTISAACVDSGGHYTQAVYEFCAQRQVRRVFAIKGVGGEGRPIVSAPSKKSYANKRHPVKLYTVGVDAAKATVYSNLRIAERGPGYCHFPTAYDQEYFEQLTAEKVVTKFHKGYPRREWQKTRLRNESLDIRAYALAAVTLLNPNFEALNAAMTTIKRPPPEPRKRSRDGAFIKPRNNWIKR